MSGGAKQNEEIVDCTQVQSELQMEGKVDKVSLYFVYNPFSSFSFLTVSGMMVRVHMGSSHRRETSP